ncbi:hypothetical protein V8F06_005831 [Rhypophila decipiens]
MRISTLLSAAVASALAQMPSAAAAAAAATEQTAAVYLQPITSSSNEIPPALLAEIRYTIPSPSDPPAAAAAAEQDSPETEVTSYEAPDLFDLPEGSKLVRLGVYNPSKKEWISSTSVVSTENFGKGYSPNFVITVGGAGADQVLGVSVRGVRIDAGQTRDFGPQAVVVRTGLGPQPELNRPVVLSPEGRKVEVVEKGFLQKYWWVLAIGAFMLMSGGGDGK